ncbi:MAG: WD40 repeat domain-containing protein [Blastochloris viridis]|uniref:WD40 repeat domain-containing protein n=1 Tax=Blastochloris viridis TaxID=1079 RepID=A0A6N4R1Y2_BLAVI|nr:MAG: WD40 repeat domain-containing protein [Blastochloris viridis]
MTKHPHTPYALGTPVNGLVWNGDTVAAAGGEGTLHLIRPNLTKALAVQVSDAPLMTVIATPEGFATADESGRIHLTTVQGEVTLLAETKYMFLENIVYFAKKKQILAATGKSVTVINQDHSVTKLPHTLPSTIGGMAISPIGPRLAVSHYGGATILALDSVKNPPRLLPWKGSHLALTYSPDGKWLISSMQEQAIHLWRLSDGMDLQMRGYPSKITQFSWMSDNTTLATNGGGGVPLWSFATEKGPAGTQARVLADSGVQDTLVTAISMHPKGPFCAIGYTDGLTLLTQTVEDRAILLHEPNSQSVSHIAWAANGMYLASAHANGTVTLTDFAALV